MVKSPVRVLKCHQILGVLFMRVLAVLYCMIMVLAGIVFGNKQTVSKAIRLWSPNIGAVVFTCTGILHVVGLFELCCKRLTKNALSDANFVHKSKNTQPRMRKVSRAMTGVKVLFDTVVKREEYLLMVTELVEVPVQTIQCYLFFEHGVFPKYGLIYASVLSLNCFTIYFSQQDTARLLVVDAIVDLLLGAGMPIAFVVTLVLDSVRDSNIATDFVWTAAALNIMQQFAVTSFIDLATSVFPLLLAHFHINLLITRWIRRSSFKKTVIVSQHGKFKWFSRFFLFWGTRLLFLTVVSHSGQGCNRATCLHENKPWFADPRECFCVTRVYQCRKGKLRHYNHRDIHELLEMDLSGNNRPNALLHLKLDGCPLEQIPQVVGDLTQLQNLWILDSKLNEFDLPMSKITDLIILFLPGNQLQEIPSVFRHFGPNLLVLSLANTLISQLPDWIPQSWQHLTILDLGSTEIQEFPMSILELKNLESLTISNLPIELPSNLTKLTKLVGFHASSCGLSTIPQLSTKNFPKLNFIGLSNNNLSALNELPWAVEEMQQSNQPGAAYQLIALTGNPVCEDPQLENTSACAPLCAPDCSTRHRSSYYCRNECNTLSCGYHDGQCAFES